MAKTNAERKRAIRYRAKGANLTDAQKKWLVDYDATKDPNPIVARPQPAAQKPAPTQSHAHPAPAPAPAPGTGTDMVPVSFDEAWRGTAPPSGVDAKPSACPVENCPACKEVRGGQVCATTGKTVWPPMSTEGSEAMAMAALGMIGLAVSMWRDDKKVVRPTKKEIQSMGGALKEVSYRRASWMGAGDDILWLFAATVGYGRRAATADGEAASEHD